MRERYLGIDPGTAAVKAAVLTGAGTCLARFAEGYPTQRQAGGRGEQDPGDWLRLIGLALHGFSDLTVGFGCLSSQVDTDDLVNAQGQAPAILWQRTRRRPGLARRFRLTRRIRWRVRHRPEVWAATAQVLLPKEDCLRHLTGQAVADPQARAL